MRRCLSSGTLVPLLLLVASGTGLAQWNGEIVAWGLNNAGQCDVPDPNEGFVALAAGSEHSLGLKEDGTIVAWGSNYYGQCDVPEPNDGFIALSAGAVHSLGLKDDGSIVAWGFNGDGQCDVPEPNEGFVAIAAGWLHSLGLKEDGTIVLWGDLSLGLPSPNDSFVSISAGHVHNLGLKADSTIVAWGDNGYGQCNVPEPNDSFIAVSASGTAGYKGSLFRDSGSFSLGLKNDGSVVAWGLNTFGQCDIPEPNEYFMAVAAGMYHGLGLKADSSIVAWGRNDEGQCNVPSPNSGFVAIAAWGMHSLGLSEISTGVEDERQSGSFIQIQSVAPNPFCMSTSVLFQSPGLSPLTLQVYDTTGRLVRTQPLGNFPAGQHTITWDGRDSLGAGLASGLFFIRLQGAEQQASAKVVLVR